MPQERQAGGAFAGPPLELFDPELAAAMRAEALRQEEHLELIASENHASPRVLEAQGSVLTNKYAEGYPGRRYYGGCEHVDVAERLAIDRARALFGAAYANVQPHSGSQANAAAYLAAAAPGEGLLGMGLADGGHLTHGARVNFSGVVYRSWAYGLDPASELIDYDQVRDLARAHRPRIIVAGFSAYSRIVDWKAFREIADEVAAVLVADMAHVAGLVATGLYPSPVGVADITTTTTHKTLRGPRGGLILARANPELEKRISSRVFPGTQGGPLMHVIAAKAVALREAATPEFKVYQERTLANARALAESLAERGYRIVSGGTDNHLMLVDLRDRPFSGRDAEAALGRARMTVNKNAVPGDPRPPVQTSGIRIGTPAMTTRGLGPEAATEVGRLIASVLDAIGTPHEEKAIGVAGARVGELCAAHPVYAHPVHAGHAAARNGAGGR